MQTLEKKVEEGNPWRKLAEKAISGTTSNAISVKVGFGKKHESSANSAYIPMNMDYFQAKAKKKKEQPRYKREAFDDEFADRDWVVFSTMRQKLRLMGPLRGVMDPYADRRIIQVYSLVN